MELSQLISQYPTLYHMAEDGAWPSIRRHGLLSTQALVELYAPSSEVRAEILDDVRRTSIELEHPEYGTVRIRDQAPLKFIDTVLSPGTTKQQFLNALNGRVFFWLTEERLQRLLRAKLYRPNYQTVLHVDTHSLMAEYAEVVELAPYNTGSMHVPNAPARGVDVFTKIVDYPYEYWYSKRGGHDPVVELTIPYAVPDIANHVTSVERWTDGASVETLFHNDHSSRPKGR